MRGKPILPCQDRSIFRITPAHAGKTHLPVPHLSFLADHPLTCGENNSLHLCRIAYSGSPPHMRGKQYPISLALLSERITPAHAGKTTQGKSEKPLQPDHPRTCGENQTCLTCSTASGGSPPHMRGKPGIRSVASIRRRITPAHAGKTFLPFLISMQTSDHPRTCGENLVRLCDRLRHGGSPPHMRGKLSDIFNCNPNYRITPAHAGKTQILFPIG